MIPYVPEVIFVEPDYANHSRTKRILDRLAGVPVRLLESPKQVDESYRYSEDPITDGKKVLWVGGNPGGHSLRKCPGIGDFVCCNYWVINVVENCHYECSYCFLQSYLTSKALKFYVNLEDIFDQLDAHARSYPNRHVRIGTGELSDSLALEHLHGFSGDLIEKFRELPQFVLELKTKSANIQPILDIPHGNNVVISWSVNPEEIVDREERHTANLNDRLMAAKAAAAKGYRIAFHFDPMIHYPNWREGYQTLIKRIFQTLTPNELAWVSIGGLRLNPGLRQIVPLRHPHSHLLREEQVLGSDDKLKYPRAIREEMFGFVKHELDQYSSEIVSYLCMEHTASWNQVYGQLPQAETRLDQQFSQRLAKIGMVKPLSHSDSKTIVAS